MFINKYFGFEKTVLNIVTLLSTHILDSPCSRTPPEAENFEHFGTLNPLRSGDDGVSSEHSIALCVPETMERVVSILLEPAPRGMGAPKANVGNQVGTQTRRFTNNPIVFGTSTLETIWKIVPKTRFWGF